MNESLTVFLQSLDLLLIITGYIIFIRAVISWLPIPKDNQLIRLLYQVTEPILAPIRNLIEKTSFGNNLMVDLSPLVVLLIIYLIDAIIGSLIV
jgi:YggT family protein